MIGGVKKANNDLTKEAIDSMGRARIEAIEYMCKVYPMEEAIRIRVETLGLSFIPEYSSARVLEHLISKWDNSRKIIAKVLYDKYSNLVDAGWPITEEQIEKDVEYFFNGNFKKIATQFSFSL